MENGNLDDPARLELVEKQFQQWQKTRWQELLAESDYSQRAQQYTFALKATLGDLYQRFARGQDEDLSEIDEQLRTGEIDETWWGLKDIAIGMKRGFMKKYKQLGLLAQKDRGTVYGLAKSSYNELVNLGLNTLTLKEIEDIRNSDDITEDEKKALKNFSNFQWDPRGNKDMLERFPDMTVDELAQNLLEKETGGQQLLPSPYEGISLKKRKR